MIVVCLGVSLLEKVLHWLCVVVTGAPSRDGSL